MVRVMVCFVLLCIVFNFFGFLIGANKADNVRGIIVNYTKISHNGTEYSEQYILLLGYNSLILLKF